MEEEEDKHFCIVCNQTISGLLNYVIHRKKTCTDKKKSTEQGVLLESKAEGNAFENEISENSSKSKENGSQAHYIESEKTSLLQSGGSSLFLDNDEATSLLKENVGGTKTDGEISLSGYGSQFNADNNSDNDGEVYSIDNASESEKNEYSDAFSSQYNKSAGIDEHGQLIEQLYLEEIPDNIRQVLLGTAENLEDVCDSGSAEKDNVTYIEMEDYGADKEVDKLDLADVKSEYGILSINVGGSSKNKCRVEADGSISLDQKSTHRRQDGCLIKRKRKASAATDRIIRDDWKSAKCVKSEMNVCEVCGLQFNAYIEYARHIKTRQHKYKLDENNILPNSEAKSVEVKVLVYSDEEVDLSINEKDEEQKNEELRYNAIEEGENGVDISGDFESDQEPTDNNVIKIEKGYSDGEATESTDTSVLNGIHNCTVCSKELSSGHELLSHLLSPLHKTQIIGKEEEYFSLIEKYQKSVIHECQFRCDICSFFFNSNIYLEHHLNGAAHKKKYERVVGSVSCSLCRFKATSHRKLMDHLQSSSHVNNLEHEYKVCAIQVHKRETTQKGRKKCSVCNICPSELSKRTSAKLHFHTAEHIRQKLALEAQKEKLEADVTNNLDGNKFDTKLTVIKNQIKKEEETSTSTVFDRPQEMLEQELNKTIELGAVDETSEETSNMMDCSENVTIMANLNGSDEQNVLIIHAISQAATDQNDKQGKSLAYNLKKASTCKYCAFETKDYSEMRFHYMKEHIDLVKICEVCDLVFPHGKGYKLHANSKDHQANIEKYGNKTEGKFPCHVCNKKFAEEGYAKFHTAYYHYHLNTEEDVLRENGNSITRTKYAEFLITVENASKKELLTCPECGSSVRQVNMIGHLRKHTGEKPFKCNICTDEFLNSSSLRRHLLSHFDLWERVCEICGEKFKVQTTYNRHMEEHRAKVTSSEKTNICHICGDAFYIKRRLREHMKQHNKKSLKCDHPGCLWAFSVPHDLKRHKLTHSNENPFICPTCGYSTKSKKYLKSHEQIHSKDKFLECEYCTYKTVTKTHLRRHMRIHLGTKPFKCPYCSYACNTHDNIRKHILETSFHKGLNVYPCRLCKYSTNCTKEFRTHLLTEHKEIAAEDLRGGSLAAFTGLFSKEEDIQAPSVGMEILPCKERKTRRKIKPEEDEIVPFVPN